MMEYTKLPNTDIRVSKIALGTMTFGEQNSETDAHQQLDFALSKGINFIDTAEMYPIPALKDTLGLTEKYIGNWIQKSGKRNEIVLATKMAGPNRGLSYIREDLRFTKENIIACVDKSLMNLKTNCIDLYQIHWPERVMNMFGKRGLSKIDAKWEDSTHTILDTFDRIIKSGKIRHIGLSNENAWGVLHFLKESEKNNLPKIVTIQNPYSLLNRLFEVGLSEISVRENVGLLAYSPLGFGFLTGKYLKETHQNSRLGLYPNLGRYSNENCYKATKLYQDLALQNGLSLTQMALAFINGQEFVTSTIVGATTLVQLEENINTHKITLSQEIVDQINLIQESIPNPAP
jgi:aryl-alcohol dehydrogenase-like predicted oxidoreductase